MSCQVKRNQNNKIVNVLAENGEHSFLYERINSLPFIGNKEDALVYYMYAIKKIKNRKDVLLDENGEPILVFKPNSTKTEYYNINGVVLEDSFESARKQDFQKKGVQLGFLSSKNAMEEQILKGGRSVQDSEFAKILDKTKSIQRTMFSNGEVKYATPQENNFIIFDTIQRDVDKTSFAGFIETLQDSGLELNETEESTSEDYTIEDISPTEKSIITIDGKKEILRLKRYKDGYKVVGKQATQKSAYLNAQKLLNGTEIYSDNLTPNTKRVWEKLVREGKAISIENGFVLKGTKAKEIGGTINIGGATLEYGERVNFVTDEPTGEIELKLVTSENKGRGESKKVIEEFLQRTDKAGRDTYLTVAPRNSETTDEGLIRLYESFGYVLEPTGFEMTRKPQFQIIGEQSTEKVNIEETTNEIISKLKENGLAEEVLQLSTQEMLDKLKELGVSDEVAFQIIGEKGASRVVSEKHLLDEAKKLKEDGRPLQEIENKTGWLFIDDQWKKLSTELINKFKVKPEFYEKINEAQKLSEILEDKSILDYYPNIGEIQVYYYDKELSIQGQEDSKFSDTSTNGFFSILSEKTGAIFINSTNEKDQGSILAHEITHLIEEIEGFPVGGDLFTLPNEVKRIIKSTSDDVISLINDIDNFNQSSLSSREKTMVSTVRDSMVYLMNTGDNYYMVGDYNNLQGEIDATLVQLLYEKVNKGEIIKGSLSEYYVNLIGDVFNQEPSSFVVRGETDIRKSVKMLPKGFVFNEKYNPTKLLNILIEKGEIEKIC